MATIFLIPAESTDNYAFVGEKEYLIGGKVFLDIQEYQDGCFVVQESEFCSCCTSDSCKLKGE